MSFMLRRSKGVTLTLSALLEGLFFITLIAVIYWFFASRFLQVYIIMEENVVERKTLLFLNSLIASEALAVEKDNKLVYGIVSDRKLKEVIDTTSLRIDFQKLKLGYPNYFHVVRVMDLEDCDSSNVCKSWVGTGLYLTEASPEASYLADLIRCFIENFKLDIGAILRFIATKFNIAALWHRNDIEKCIKESGIPENLFLPFSKSEVISKGLPILIYYEERDIMHIGRISGGLWKVV